MKTYKHILAAAALTVLTACTSEDNTTETPKEPGIPITLSYTISDITPETRAAQNLNEGYLDAAARSGWRSWRNTPACLSGCASPNTQTK